MRGTDRGPAASELAERICDLACPANPPTVLLVLTAFHLQDPDPAVVLYINPRPRSTGVQVSVHTANSEGDAFNGTFTVSREGPVFVLPNSPGATERFASDLLHTTELFFAGDRESGPDAAEPIRA